MIATIRKVPILERHNFGKKTVVLDLMVLILACLVL
jgi:hypothetical protein